ncbi:MAG: hypothetical protein RL172_881 [Bacteroidota bacterium]
MVKLRYIFFFAALQASFFAKADITLPAFINNGMVLQRNAPINIWGWAAAGEKVSIRFDGKTYHALTGSDGKWEVVLDKHIAGGPYQLHLQGNNTIVLNDVLVGDVWIAAGQSNMEYEMRNVKELYKKEIAQSANKQIRQFTVTKAYSFTTLTAVTAANGGWIAANPENTPAFSAVAYFFAVQLHQQNNVPIGIINTTWGGTPAEAWMSREALQPFTNYVQRYEYIKQPENIASLKASVSEAKLTYEQQLNQYFTSDTTGFYCSGALYNVNDWPKMKLPALWETAGLPANHDGMVWFRKEIMLPEDAAGKPAQLELSYIDDIDNTYVNGQLVGSSAIWNEARKYNIPAGVLKAGKNIIAVKIMDTGGGGGIYGDGNLQLSVAGNRYPLNTEWQYQPFPQQVLPPYPWDKAVLYLHYEPTTMYNAMLAPLIPYSIKGVIWYQGEANVNRAKEYESLFPAMIADWRKRFGQGNFPFLFVQLANYNDLAPGADWAALRAAQLKTLTTSPNTGMAVTIDVGEAGDIHPRNKKEVGLRLALAAQKIAYRKNVVHSGPVYKQHTVQQHKWVIQFTNTGTGLATRGAVLTGFEIAGPDKKFVPAQAIIRNNMVEVWSAKVPSPAAVRYAWANSPDGCNLYNQQGLPAAPFWADKP